MGLSNSDVTVDVCEQTSSSLTLRFCMIAVIFIIIIIIFLFYSSSQMYGDALVRLMWQCLVTPNVQ